MATYEHIEDYEKYREGFQKIDDETMIETMEGQVRGPILRLLDKIPFLDDKEKFKKFVAISFWSAIGIALVTITITALIFFWAVRRSTYWFASWGNSPGWMAFFGLVSIVIEVVGWVFSWTGVAAVIAQIIQIILDMFALTADWATRMVAEEGDDYASIFDIIMGLGGLIPLFGLVGNLGKTANKMRKAVKGVDKAADAIDAASDVRRAAKAVDAGSDVARTSRKVKFKQGFKKIQGRVREDLDKGDESFLRKTRGRLADLYNEWADSGADDYQKLE